MLLEVQNVTLGVSVSRRGRIHAAIGDVEFMGGPVRSYRTLCGRTMKLLPRSWIEATDTPCAQCQKKWRIVNVGGVWFEGQDSVDS